MTAQELTSKFGKKVQFYRKMNKMTQAGLAEKLDVSIKTISDIENGRAFVTAETLSKLSSIYKIAVYKLFTPDNIEYDNAPEILSKYCGEVKEAMENIEKDYLRKIKPPTI